MTPFNDQYGTRVVDCLGRIVATSRNLRGMREYARKSPVVRVVTKRDPSNPFRGILHVEYMNRATCSASFASFHIMIDFVRNRRTWRSALIEHLDGDVGYLTKPGVIAGPRRA